MPEWTPQLLLFVFVTHMPFFAWRWRRTGEVRYAATTLTFGLLVITYTLLVFAPDAQWFAAPAYMWVRIPAWISALVSSGLFMNHVLRGRLRRGDSGT